MVIAGKYADQAAELLRSYQSSDPPTLITAAHGPVEAHEAPLITTDSALLKACEVAGVRVLRFDVL